MPRHGSRARTSDPAVSVGAKRGPDRWLWAAVALGVTGIVLAIWGRLGAVAFVEAETAAGREHDVLELFRLSIVWLAAFWGGLLVTIAAATFVGVRILGRRRPRA